MEAAETELVILDGLEVNIAEQTVMFKTKEIYFTNREFQVLCLLVTHPRRVYSKEQIYRIITNDEIENYHTVEITISRIRKKLEQCTNKNYIFAIRGRGYKLLP